MRHSSSAHISAMELPIRLTTPGFGSPVDLASVVYLMIPGQAGASQVIESRPSHYRRRNAKVPSGMRIPIRRHHPDCRAGDRSPRCGRGAGWCSASRIQDLKLLQERLCRSGMCVRGGHVSVRASPTNRQVCETVHRPDQRNNDRALIAIGSRWATEKIWVTHP